MPALLPPRPSALLPTSFPGSFPGLFPGLILTLLAACGSDDSGADPGTDAADTADGSGDISGDTSADVDQTTPGAGTTSLTIPGPDRGRDLRVQVWYPTDASLEVRGDHAALETGELATTMATLLEGGVADCVRPDPVVSASAPLAPAALGEADAWRLVLMSHCYGCSRLSMAQTAESLARAGYVVVAPDHLGTTIHDTVADTTLPLTSDTLELRAGDLDQVFAALPSLATSPDPILSEVFAETDLSAVWLVGHSFGAATVGLFAQRHAEAVALVAVAAPVANILFPAVDLTQIDVPALLLLATEDNSIAEIGNTFIRQNVEDWTGGAATLSTFEDAGHFAFSDLCGLTDNLMAGCGEDDRQTNGEPFVYAPPAGVRDRAAAEIVGFFEGVGRED